jgi:soluble lytic murein transglycosylase-like protein
MGDGDVIQYFVDPSGQVIIHTASDQVEWGTPKLAAKVVPAFKAMIKNWQELVEEASVDYRVPAAWLYAIMHSESGGDPKATSPAGALGLMQVMPMHFKAGENPLDPRTNIRRGASILQAARAKGPDIVQSASIYNAGTPPDGKGPWTNAVWLAAGRKPSQTTRWGYAAEPNYLDHVVAANNTFVSEGNA